MIGEAWHSYHAREFAAHDLPRKDRGPRLEIDFAEFPTLGVWTKPSADFICIEPWQGFSDPVGYAGDIRDKPGIIEIAAGDRKRLAMQIRLIDELAPTETHDV